MSCRNPLSPTVLLGFKHLNHTFISISRTYHRTYLLPFWQVFSIQKRGYNSSAVTSPRLICNIISFSQTIDNQHSHSVLYTTMRKWELMGFHTRSKPSYQYRVTPPIRQLTGLRCTFSNLLKIFST